MAQHRKLVAFLLTLCLLCTNLFGFVHADIIPSTPTDLPCQTHNWVNGVCSECNTACPDASAHTNEFVCYENQTNYVCVDNTEHTFDGDIVLQYICQTCGGWIQRNHYSKIPENHTWVDGTCSGCGYACTHTWVNGACSVCGSACAHTNKTFAYEGSHAYTGYAPSTDNDRMHVASYDAVQYYTCSDCGMTDIAGETLTKTEQQAHVFPVPNGDCSLCFGICMHYFDANGVCEDCGALCGHQWVNGICSQCTMVCTHQYSAGICQNCGYICQHPEVSQWTETRNQMTALNPEDNLTHIVSYEEVAVSQCSTCFAVMYGVPMTHETVERHTMNLASLTCSKCGYQCTHMQTVTKYEVVSVEPLDEISHLCKEQEVSYKSCKVCNLTGYGERTPTGNTREVTRPHDMYAWECQECGHKAENPYPNCTHPDKNVSYVTSGQCTRMPYDNEKHQLVYPTASVGYWCPDCQKELDPVQETNFVDYEPHYYGSEGNVCLQCGFENLNPTPECQHILTEMRIDYFAAHSYKALNGTQHQFYAYWANNTYCKECGHSLNKYNDVQYTEQVFTENHTWNENRVCTQCGFTCDHPESNAWTEEQNQIIVQNPDDKRTHIVTYDEVPVSQCTSCQELFYGEPVTQSYVTGHSFNPATDTCYLCGLHCTHAETVTMYQNLSVESVDALFHLYKQEEVTFRKCDECGLHSEHVPTGKTREVTSHHTLGGLECWKCGYERPNPNPDCTHSNKEYSWSYSATGEQTIAPYDEETHSVFYPQAFVIYWCPDCQTELDEVYETNFTGYSSHYYPDGKICDECGYANPNPTEPCKHPNREQSMYYMMAHSYVPVNGQEHQFAAYWGTEEYCLDCDQYVPNSSRDYYEEKTYTEPHTMNSNGLCEHCGYQCTHAETVVRYSAVSFESVSDYSHLRKEAEFTYKRCNECGWSSGWVRTGNVREVKSHHNMDGLECIDCGYQQESPIPGCTHANKSDYGAVVESFGNETCEYVDADAHVRTYEKAKVVYWCDDCGARLEPVIETNYTEDSVHYYTSGSNVCEDCGYENPNACLHTNLVEEEYAYNEHSFVSLNDTEHQFTAYWGVDTYCADCGAYVGGNWKEYYEDKIFVEEHWWDDNGICMLCEAVQPAATPTPELTPTPEPTATPTPVPTPTPKPNRPRPTAVPPLTPSPEPSPSVSPEPSPTVSPDPTPAPELNVPENVTPKIGTDAVNELLNVAENLVPAAETTEVKVEVVAAKEVLNEEEYTELKELSAQEQILVVLSSVGLDTIVQEALQNSNISMSDKAAALMNRVNARMAADTETPAEMEKKLEKYFPKQEIVVNGKPTTFYIVELLVEVDGVSQSVYYGFQLDENGQWVLVPLNAADVPADENEGEV